MVFSAYRRLALLAGLFGLHGGALLAVHPVANMLPEKLQLLPAAQLDDFGVGWLMGLACWWAIWPTLRAGSPWRGWLEGLAIIGATYGTMLLIGAAINVFQPKPAAPEPNDGAIHNMFLYALICAAILEVIILMLTFSVLALVTRWLLEIPRDGAQQMRQFSMGEMLLLIVVVALHTLAGQDLLRDALTWDWKNFQNWWLTEIAGRLVLLAIPTVFAFLAPVCCILAKAVRWWVPPVMVAASFLTFCAIHAAFHHERPVLFSLLSCLGIATNATLTALALKWMGFRLTGGRAMTRNRHLQRALATPPSLQEE